MDAAPIDPRDGKWEQKSPVYRVCFWEPAPLPPGVDISHQGWSSEEWRLTDAADVHEVLAWATGPVGQDRRFELFVEVAAQRGLGLRRLSGSAC